MFLMNNNRSAQTHLSLKQPSPTLRGLECEPITPDWINQKGDGSKKRIAIRIAALGC